MNIQRPEQHQLRRLYLDEGRTVAEIAAIFGVARGTAHNWLRAARIELRRSPSAPRHDITDAEIRDLYVTKRLSAAAIASRLGCGTTTIYRRLDQLDIPRRPNTPTSVRPDRADLEHLYRTEGLSLRQIATRFDVTATTVAGWLRRHDIAARPAGAPAVELDHDAVVDGYRNGLNGPQVAFRHHCSTATIYRILVRHGIPRRELQPALTRHDLVDALDRRCTAVQIAHVHNVSVSAVCRALRREGLMTSSQAARQRTRHLYTAMLARADCDGSPPHRVPDRHIPEQRH